MAGPGPPPGPKKIWWRVGWADESAKRGKARPVKADRLHTWRRGLSRRQLFSEERAESGEVKRTRQRDCERGAKRAFWASNPHGLIETCGIRRNQTHVLIETCGILGLRP